MKTLNSGLLARRRTFPFCNPSQSNKDCLLV